ncbi:hypothetical protein KUTeg_008579 [Tegillarca granosa]|uniref:Uncharacterized protein n=1 Tax=Tegillarca granosa TaxID=220873 RepID=A0ABQ9F9I9_TEGGR|nr:hypothetical protein KUTeg_008579 [Tegillarca granosa]
MKPLRSNELEAVLNKYELMYTIIFLTYLILLLELGASTSVRPLKELSPSPSLAVEMQLAPIYHLI